MVPDSGIKNASFQDLLFRLLSLLTDFVTLKKPSFCLPISGLENALFQGYFFNSVALIAPLLSVHSVNFAAFLSFTARTTDRAAFDGKCCSSGGSCRNFLAGHTSGELGLFLWILFREKKEC